MSKKDKDSNYYYANVSEHEWDILTPLEGKMITRIRAFGAMIDRATGARRMMLYTTQQLAQEWKTSERSIMRARAGLLEKGLVEKKEWKNRTLLVPVSIGWSDAACHDTECHPDATCHVGGDTARHLDMTQRVTSALYIKELEDKNKKIRKEEEEGLKPLSPSAPRPSASCDSDLAHSSAISSTREIQTQVQNPPFVSDPTALEALVDQLVAKKLAEASKSDENLPALTESRVDQKKAKEKALRPSDGRYRAYNEADFFFPDSWSGLGRDAMARWVDHKNKIKKPLFQESYQQLLKNHVSNETLFVLSVNKSIAAGYQGLIPPDRNELQEHTRNLNAERLANDQVSPALAAFMKGMTNNG